MMRLTKHNALERLKKYTNASREPREGGMSQAEDLLLGCLVGLIEEKTERRETSGSGKLGHEVEKEYRKLKHIARCLGHFPVSDDTIKAYQTRERITGRAAWLEEVKLQWSGNGKYEYAWKIAEGEVI